VAMLDFGFANSGSGLLRVALLPLRLSAAPGVLASSPVDLLPIGYRAALAMTTNSFSPILEQAQHRKGGPEALKALMPEAPASAAELGRLADAKALSLLSRGVFRAGFNWTVVDKRWPDIEVALHGFDPERIAPFGSREITRYLKHPGVIKNRSRLEAVIENARWFLDLRGEYGSLGKMLAQWPSSEIAGLWRRMNRDGSRIGVSTGSYFLREVGKDSFLPTHSVMSGLVARGVIDRPTTGIRNLAAAQAAFNDWHEETGRPYGELSRIVAYSVPD